MMKINDVFSVVDEAIGFRGVHRVLCICEKDNLIFTIEIRARVEGGASPRYFKGPVERHFDLIKDAEGRGQIALSKFLPPPTSFMNDEQIRTRYPMRGSETKRKSRTDSSALQKRDRDWAYIEPVLAFVVEQPVAAFQAGMLSAYVSERVKELGCQRRAVLDPLHRVLALGCGKNSLLDFRARCGGAGKTRTPKKCSQLGPRSTAISEFHLSDLDKSRIADSYRLGSARGLSMRECWILNAGAWWHDGHATKDGVLVPLLLPQNQRPSYARYSYWAKAQSWEERALAIIRSKGKSHRSVPKVGSAFDGVRSVGQVGVMDATPADVELVSVGSALKAVGMASRIFVHEGLSDVITGVYCGFDAPSGHTALQACFSSASDLVQLGKRLNITIEPHQIPAVWYRKFLVDNGEMRCAHSTSTMTALGSALELAEKSTPHLKVRSESGHRSAHKLLDHKIDGTTRGRPRERGEDHAAISACWTWYEYMAELIKAIIYFNCFHDASDVMALHPFRTEMARDNVPARRADMHAWMVKNHRVASPSFEIEHLRAQLLPVTRALVRKNGIFLLRPDCGNKPEILRGPRFHGARALELGWYQGSTFQIEVRHDPQNLAVIWYVDEMGLHRFENICSDEILKRELTLQECLVMQDDEKSLARLNKDESDQEFSNFVTSRENTNLGARTRKKKEIKAEGRKVPKTELRSNIHANREQEREHVSEFIYSASGVMREPEKTCKPDDEQAPIPDAPPKEPESDAERVLREFRARRKGAVEA